MLTAARCDISDRTGTNLACVMFNPQLTGRSKLYCGTFVPSPHDTHEQNDPNDVAVIVFDKTIRGITLASAGRGLCVVSTQAHRRLGRLGSRRCGRAG